MITPYVAQPVDAYVVAQSSLAAALTAVVWARPLGSRAANGLFVLAIWLAALLPLWGDVLVNVASVPLGPPFLMTTLRVSAFLATLATLLGRPRWLALVAVLGEVFLYVLCAEIKESDYELAGLHVAWFGALLGLSVRANAAVRAHLAPEPTAPTSYLRRDLVLFAATTLVAALVAWLVLERSMTSDDEWAYMYQADVLGHGQAFGPAPPCGEAFRAHWVFTYEGRTFSQYTPGWPMVLAPFARFGVAWLVAPLTHGLLAVGVARVARRARRDTAKAPPSERDVSLTGVVAALVATMGATPLLNGGSRFPHTLVAALFAWGIEAACTLGDAKRSPRPALGAAATSRRSEWGWGAVLGLGAAFILATRPPDGGTLLFAIFLYFVYALVRRRFGLRGFFGVAVPFALIAGLTLVILHAQLGAWLKTGYNIAQQFYSWAEVKFSIPAPSQYKYGLPFMTGAYMFFPCSVALGVAGLAQLLARRALRLLFMLGSGLLLGTVLLVLLEFGRGNDFGYGPRYHLTFVVPFGVGAGVLLGPILHEARLRSAARSPLRAAGPAVLLVLALASGMLRHALPIYASAHGEMHTMDAIYRAARQMGLKNAVVVVSHGASTLNPLDVTRNDPTDPDPDVIYIGEHRGEDTQCVRELYPDRFFYRAQGRPDATLVPMP